MNVIEYFSCENQALWRSRIAQGDWTAATFLAKLLEQPEKIPEAMGETPKLYLLVEGDALLSFAVLSKIDCILAPERFPWIGFVYTFPQYRRQGFCAALLTDICQKAKSMGYERIWIATDQPGLYERFGFTYTDSLPDRWSGQPEMVYCKHL